MALVEAADDEGYDASSFCSSSPSRAPRRASKTTKLQGIGPAEKYKTKIGEEK